MAKDYVFTPPPNWPAPPRGWVPPPGWTPDPEWGPAPDGWEFWTQPEGGTLSWFGQHTVLTGIAATTLVIGGVVGISAFANGAGGKAPVAAATSPTLLTALDDTNTSSSPEDSLSPSSESPTESPTESQSPTPTTSPTRSETKSPSSTPTQTRTSPTSSPTRTGPRVYLSCQGMNRDHPHGVGRPGARDRVKLGEQRVRDFDVNAKLYTANRGLDTDGDGIACER
jgi:hypothetical protein